MFILQVKPLHWKLRKIILNAIYFVITMISYPSLCSIFHVFRYLHLGCVREKKEKLRRERKEKKRAQPFGLLIFVIVTNIWF